MEYNKVIIGKKTLIDLTEDTVTAATLLKGYTAHSKTGEKIEGTYVSGSSEKPQSKVISYSEEKTITETYGNEQVDKTIFNDDGSVTEMLADGHAKTTVFNDDGSITVTCRESDGTVAWAETDTVNADGTLSVKIS